MTTVGVAIPSIPPRRDMLARALTSVMLQERVPDQLAVSLDFERRGAAVNRNRAWRMLNTDYVAFLDDDDEFMPVHLKRCLEVAIGTDADMVYPWFHLPVGSDPFAHFGLPWNPDDPVQTTIVCVWKRSALERIGGFPEEELDGVDGHGNRNGEDHQAVLRLSETGGKIVHIPERTWIWHWHGANTSGLNTRW